MEKRGTPNPLKNAVRALNHAGYRIYEKSP